MARATTTRTSAGNVAVFGYKPMFLAHVLAAHCARNSMLFLRAMQASILRRAKPTRPHVLPQHRRTLAGAATRETTRASNALNCIQRVLGAARLFAIGASLGVILAEFVSTIAAPYKISLKVDVRRFTLDT